MSEFDNEAAARTLSGLAVQLVANTMASDVPSEVKAGACRIAIGHLTDAARLLDGDLDRESFEALVAEKRAAASATARRPSP